MAEIQRPSGLKTREVGSGVARAAGVCTCINPDGLCAEQTHRLTCPGASRLYGEVVKELALAPVGLARQRTKWPCDQVGPPGPPPAHPSCPLDPRGAGWGEISLPGLPVRAAAPLYSALPALPPFVCCYKL
jgi:hypothetical protein